MTTLLDISKLAVLYLRQSTLGQLRDNVVATAEQYKLREIPERLGFPADRIVVVDEDLGVSGTTIAGRTGMLRVLDLLERGRVSCVVVRDIGRLTRDAFNADIAIIARQCYHAGAQIVTPDKTYDLSDPADQFTLGLQGLLAGWDHSNIVRRLAQHRKAKQARGTNINGAVPPGYEKIIDVPKSSSDYGRLRITVDGEVRERMTLILRKGLELGGILAVVRFLRAQDLRVPILRGEESRFVTGADGVTRAVGAGRRIVQWVEPTRDRVTRILKNPTCAGAIVNGRRTRELDPGTGRRRWTTRRPYERCTVIRDAHPPYISWEEHCQLIATIARNNQAKTFGAGQALLSGLGLLKCGVCGAPMVVQYNNPQRRARGRVYRNTPFTYTCSRRARDGRALLHQNPAGPYIDQAARELVLFGLGQLDLDGLREVRRERQRRVGEADRLGLQRVEVLTRRARMLEDAIGDATRPEARSRLVARFEDALAELEAARQSANRPSEREAPELSPQRLRRLEVFRDPAAAWSRFTTKTRKEVIRALVGTAAIHPDLDGYFLVFDWADGGRAAARVKTIRRQKLYVVPGDVLALFGDDSDTGHRRVAGRLGRGRRGGRASPRPDAAGCPHR
ncbi:MAG: hypothetical protein DMD96_06030 [Candidatus Rokuibacteriota bacterium]|nr:MAG: hypothetical protein DMD96_06030 [Candidatus Rokubacteria bacterium]